MAPLCPRIWIARAKLFLHITTAPDNTNNILALAFGVLIVALVVAGSVWIMYHLNGNLMPTEQIMQMQR
jgi:cytochrome o ubiquinol oxidase subunit IV